MKVTIKDIANEVGVSTAAVSKALNDLPGVSDQLRLRVKQTAQRMGYTKYLKASMVNAYERNMKFIVVLYGPVPGYIMEDIQDGIAETIRRKGYYELRYMIDTFHHLHSEKTKELFLEKISRERGVVGVLSAYIRLSDVLIAKLHEQKMPVVLLENYTDYGRCVTIDNAKATHRAVLKLAELGRKRIGCIIPPDEADHVWADRFKGYKRGLRDAGLEYDPTLVIFETWVDMKAGALATKALMEKKPDIDAILYASDRLACGGLKMLHDMGRKVPDEVAVIGFDDIEYNTVLRPTLSSVRQPICKMAETGLGLLLDSIEKDDFTHRAIELDTELMLRGSCLKDYEEAAWG